MGKEPTYAEDTAIDRLLFRELVPRDVAMAKRMIGLERPEPDLIGR